MTRILVFSDSHDTVEFMEKTVENMVGVDYIFHLGDHSRDARYLELVFPEKSTIMSVATAIFAHRNPLIIHWKSTDSNSILLTDTSMVLKQE